MSDNAQIHALIQAIETACDTTIASIRKTVTLATRHDVGTIIEIVRLTAEGFKMDINQGKVTSLRSLVHPLAKEIQDCMTKKEQFKHDKPKMSKDEAEAELAFRSFADALGLNTQVLAELRRLTEPDMKR